MSKDETKPKGETSPADFGFASFGEMMSQMRNMCCTRERRFSGCFAGGKGEMKPKRDQSGETQESNTESEEGKK